MNLFIKDSPRRRLLSSLLATVVAFGLFAPLQISSAQGADSCTKANAVKVASGVKFVCKKTGGKLKWVRQGSNSVVTTQTPRPSPSPNVKEWTRCPSAGRVSGSGETIMSCVKVAGKLRWVRNSTLDTPSFEKPCRVEGSVGPWRDEFLICTNSSYGRIWQRPAADEYIETKPQVPVTQSSTVNYRLNSTTNHCFSPDFKAVLDVQMSNGEWQPHSNATWVARSCPSAGLGGFELNANLPTGTAVRMRVMMGPSHYLITEPTMLQGNPNVFLSRFNTQMTPKTTVITSLDLSGQAGGILFEFVDYQKIDRDSIFTYRLRSDSRALKWGSLSAVQADTGAVTIVEQPIFGTTINPSGLIKLRLRIDSNFLMVNQLTFDLSGQIGASNITKRFFTSFTWR